MNWVIGFNTCTYRPHSLREECYRAARLIHESAEEIGEVPNLLFSGGSESEIVVRSFHEQQLPFRVSILRYKKNLNLHDIAFAVTFCIQRKIPYDIIDLNIVKFWEDEVDEYAARTHCPTPQLPPTMWLADQVEGIPVLGSGEPYVKKDVPEDYEPGVSEYKPSMWFFEEKERIQAWYRHFFRQQRPAVPGFFQYTPELMYMFLVDPVVMQLVNNQRIGKLSTVSSKSEIYRGYFKDMLVRPKFGGFEMVMAEEEIVRERLTEWYGDFNRSSLIEYSQMVGMLSAGFRSA